MSPFPPPTGRPATMFPRPDPWAEQERRKERHRAERRRRRRRWLIPVALLTVAAGAVTAWYLVDQAMVAEQATEQIVETGPAPSAAASATESEPESEPTVPPDQLVTVDQVWLIDRGDGVYDWGVSVRTPALAETRSGVVIDVRLIDSDDGVVETVSGEVNGIGPESIGSVTGRLTEAEDVPVRLEFDVAVGVPSNDRALGDVLDVRALVRTTDSVRGRIRAESTVPIDDVTMVLVWFDDDGTVVAAVPQSVEQVRPDVDARFDIDLRSEVVPDGRPDAVVWTG